MGIIFRGLPPYLIEIAREMGIHQAWETGTYLGETSIVLARAFEKVSTVEASDELWRSTKGAFNKLGNIKSFNGASPEVLEKELKKGENYFFWLDAHWSGDITFGEGEKCPVLEELYVIKNANLGSSVLICIDDARLFSAPHDLAPLMKGWPRLVQILTLIKEMGLSSFIFDDVIIAVSPHFEVKLMDRLLEINISRQDHDKTTFHDNEDFSFETQKQTIFLRIKRFYVAFFMKRKKKFLEP